MSKSLTINQCAQTVGWDFEQTTTWGPNIPATGSFSQAQTFINGTGAGKAQKLYLNTFTIASGSGTGTITLSNFTDPFGATAQAMTKVHGIFIQNTLPSPAPTAQLTITGNFLSAGGSPDLLTGTTPGVQLLPGNTFMVVNNTAAGYAVTASTGDTITLTNTDSTNSAIVNVCVWGE